MRINKKRTITLAAALFLILLCAPIARAAEFVADVAIDRNGTVSGGTAYVKGANVRYELGREVVIFRADFGAQWTIYPKKAAYAELWDYLSDEFIMPEATPRLRETASDAILGTETVSEYVCDIHYYRYDDPARGTLTAWRSLRLDYPIKIEVNRRDHHLTKEYTNIREALLDDWLFELPAGYTMLK